MGLSEQEKSILQSVPVSEKQELIKEPKNSENKKSIEDAETDLRLQRIEFEKKKLEMEMSKLNAPSSNIDYYSKMLEMQNNFHLMILANEREKQRLELELIKKQLSDGDESSKWMEFLEPLLPRFLSGITGRTTAPEEPIYVNNEFGELVPNPRLYPPQSPPISSTEQAGSKESGSFPSQLSPASNIQEDTEGGYEMDVKQYQQDIRDGKISLEQAWKDWQANLSQMPRWLQGMTFEEFKQNYDKIRAGGKI